MATEGRRPGHLFEIVFSATDGCMTLFIPYSSALMVTLMITRSIGPIAPLVTSIVSLWIAP